MKAFSSDFISQCHSELAKYGHFLLDVSLPEELSKWINKKNYQEIDTYFQKELSLSGNLFKTLKLFCPVQEIEFIISKRSAEDEWEEDGIWHDDGSRILAFSLSLTKTSPAGGVLEIRKKGMPFSSYLLTPQYGEMIVFSTGEQGYEHKINAVTSGERLIIAGWCTP